MATKKAVKRVVKKPARKVARKVVKRKAKAVKCTTRQAAVARKVQQAAKLYKAFHGEAPKKVTRKKASAPVRVGMVLGKLEAVIYETPDGKRYMHPGGDP
jgi:sorbitol-specific phosphotransferase system component IIBC